MKRKFSFKKTINTFILVASWILFIICAVHIMLYLNDSKKSKKQIKKIKEKTIIKKVDDNADIIESNEDKDNPYWSFIKMSLIDVDLKDLKKQNSDTIGWIQIKGTNINYPFVQAKDNDYYLTHSFDKSYNDAGWIFLDYRNDLSKLEKNTIIYGHGRYDKTMFGTLKNIFTNDWLKNKENYVIQISSDSYNTMWQVFSVYKIETTTDYLSVNFKDDDFENFIAMIKNRSNFDFKTNVNKDDNILTLSTCYDNNTKVVLHAKLIKKMKK